MKTCNFHETQLQGRHERTFSLALQTSPPPSSSSGRRSDDDDDDERINPRNKTNHHDHEERTSSEQKTCNFNTTPLSLAHYFVLFCLKLLSDRQVVIFTSIFVYFCDFYVHIFEKEIYII